MPLLVRAAHVDEVPPGASRVVRVRDLRVRIARVGDAWHALDASTAPLPDRVTAHDVDSVRRSGARVYRAVVRGTFVHVALDPDRQSAPASIQRNSLPATALA